MKKTGHDMSGLAFNVNQGRETLIDTVHLLHQPLYNFFRVKTIPPLEVVTGGGKGRFLKEGMLPFFLQIIPPEESPVNHTDLLI